MKTLYRFLLLMAILLIAQFSVKAQTVQSFAHTTITGLGDREPANPSAKAMARLQETSTPTQPAPAAPAPEQPSPDSLALPVKAENTQM